MVTGRLGGRAHPRIAPAPGKDYDYSELCAPPNTPCLLSGHQLQGAVC